MVGVDQDSVSKTWYWLATHSADLKVAFGASNSDLDLRAASSLSCNPYQHQPLPLNNNADSAPCSYPASSGTSFSESFRNLQSRKAARIFETDQGGLLRRARSRPLSWVSFGRDKTQRFGAKSPSMPLPHQNSMSSVAKSSISSPMLTSTTNARVAGIENIECSDVLLPDYSSQRAVSNQSARTQGTVSQHSQKLSDKHSGWTSTVRSVKKKLSHTRRASTSLLMERPWVRRASEKIGRSTTPSAASDHVLRRIDTSKGKIQQRREGDQQAKSDPGSTAVYLGSTSEANELTGVSHTTPNIQQAPRLPGLYSDSTTDLDATSLSRSFASAVDKLDFQSSPTLVHDGTPMSRLKKAKSYFSLRNASRENSLGNFENSEDYFNLHCTC